MSDIKGVTASAMVAGLVAGDHSPRWIKALKKIGKLPTAKPALA
ncbi:hypothetical protein [Methylicorpusculum oleiharenae]|nr:hypothetical protein [Methylicorpusculum oleiharenae]